MLHKSMIIYASYIFVVGPLFFSTQTLKPSAGPTKPPAGQFPMDMSEDEMKMFTEFIESLDQETLDALNAIGEEIIKEADELGIDPFDYIQLQAQQQQEYEEKALKDTKSKTSSVVTQQPTSAEAQTAQDLFKGIAQVIPVIMQKAVSDTNLSNDLLPFKYRLDDLVYYCTRLADEKMLKYLADANFKPLVDDARTLYKELTALNNQFVVAEFNLEGESPYDLLGISRSASQDEIITAYDKLLQIIDPATLELQLIKDGKTDDEIKKEVTRSNARLESINDAYDVLRSKEEASYILNKILDAVSTAVDTKKMIEQATKVLQLHEPEALKLKKEQEKLEAEARKTQDAFIKKRPIVSRSFTMPMPKHKGGGKRYDEGRGGRAGYTPTRTPKKKETFKPSKVSTSGKPAGSGAKPTGKPLEKKDEKDGKGKKKTGGAKPAAKPGAPAKRGGDEGKGKEGESKKPNFAEVSTALGAIDVTLTAIKKVIKKHKAIINDKNPLAEYATKPFVGTPEAIEAEKKAYTEFLKDLSAALAPLESSIRAGLKKFKDKKEELKQYKEAVAERITKFEKLDKFKVIKIIFAPKFAPGEKLSMQGASEGVSMNKDKENLLFTTKPEGKDEPYMDQIRAAYEIKKQVMPKDDGKKSGQPAGPIPAPFISSGL